VRVDRKEHWGGVAGELGAHWRWGLEKGRIFKYKCGVLCIFITKKLLVARNRDVGT